MTASRSSSPAPSAAADPATAGDDGRPRYLRVADDLKRAIADGTYPVGAHLPTEIDLCAHFGISRFTAREAVRVLSAAGLVTRRQRVGTVVIATPDEARYTHDASSTRELLQYALDTELRFVYVGRIALGREQARDFGAKPGEEWIYALGLRVAGNAQADGTAATGAETPLADARPICVTRLFLNPVLAGIEDKLRQRKGAVYGLIESEHGLAIHRVEQELQGVVLDAEDAANLGAAPGAPALRIVRRYYTEAGQLLEVSDNVHPSDRFSYRMQLHR